jgi:endonuclease III
MVAIADAKLHASAIARRLKASYPDAVCALHFSSPLELLIATILSAQCTDARVNIVTRDLFRQYHTAEDYAQASLTDLQKAVQTAGFFRMKAKNIKACCTRLVAEFGGEVPRDMEALVSLPGVGRKTASVVLGVAFGIADGVVVDTHVKRLTHRLGLTRHKDPIKIERDLMALLPRKQWIDFSHRLIHHGRKICKARKPLCDACPLEKLCPRIGVRVA